MIHGSMRHTPSGRRKTYNAWTTKKSKPVEFKPLNTHLIIVVMTFITLLLTVAGVQLLNPDQLSYTGTLVKGIGTMHKSNAVPVIDEQQMKDLASMRR